MLAPLVPPLLNPTEFHCNVTSCSPCTTQHRLFAFKNCPTLTPPPSTRQIEWARTKQCNYCWVCFSSLEHIQVRNCVPEGVCWRPACILRSCDSAALPCCAWTPEAVKWVTGVKPQPTGPTVHSLPALSRSSTFAQCLHQLPIASCAAGRYMSEAEDQFQPQCVDTRSLTTCSRPLA